MPDIEWQPIDKKPSNAAEIEAEIDRIARGGVVRLTLGPGGWRVRALLPAAMCARGTPVQGREISDRVEDILSDFDCPVAPDR